MNLSRRNTQALVRGMATASRVELDECAKELKAIAGDLCHPPAVRMTAKEIGVLIRKQMRRF